MKASAETKGTVGLKHEVFLQFTPQPGIDGSFDVACAVVRVDVHYEEKYGGCAHLSANDMLHVHAQYKCRAAFFPHYFHGRLTLMHQNDCGVLFLSGAPFVNGLEARWSPAANEMTLARVQYSLDCHAGMAKICWPLQNPACYRAAGELQKKRASIKCAARQTFAPLCEDSRAELAAALAISFMSTGAAFVSL